WTPREKWLWQAMKRTGIRVGFLDDTTHFTTNYVEPDYGVPRTDGRIPPVTARGEGFEFAPTTQEEAQEAPRPMNRKQQAAAARQARQKARMRTEAYENAPEDWTGKGIMDIMKL
ncbi:MAG: hypothetical protein NWE79_02470, partial [Candidatus Bathyarchaeota archaeon]|nr:hypothetical protein [Candidatus Bathyarchaeota archaeon]